MIRDYKSPKWDEWYDGLIDDPSRLPITFTYDNKSYCGFSDNDLILLDKMVFEKDGKKEARFTYSLSSELNIVLILSRCHRMDGVV